MDSQSGDNKKAWEEPGFPKDMKELFQQLEYLKDESDLGCILIAGSFIDLCLEPGALL